ncbi:MAG: DUF1501 domain-containing protein [Bryobacter sp.]|jgi:uncharacterized protein (DUF1501 family)|nr:DUF1501 domain-containing protein [Bryobacter sp.]
MDRRRFLTDVGWGAGAIALGDLLAADGKTAAGAVNPLAPKKPHFAPKAKSVIFMFMEGGPSQFDLFDPKPALQKYHGQSLPESLTKDLQLAFIKPTAAVLASPRQFKPAGKCGMELSDYIPHLHSVADDLCLVRSMSTDAFNHHPGQLLLFTGFIQPGRPTMGAWSVYGLGSESQNLPGFVVLASGAGTSGGATNFSSGFLPSAYQGTLFRGSGDPILYLSNPSGVSNAQQRAALDAVRDLNQERMAETGDAEIASRIASYELAYRMQMSAPELIDFSKESKETMAMYGLDKDPKNQYATNCLLARRLVERGVRFVLMMHASWDDHTNLNRKLKRNCEISDQANAALIKDLKQRGLLDSTLVVWGGEFGRTPMQEVRDIRDPEGAGRDHHPNAYSLWLAGGGIKGGQVIGRTDDLGFNVVEDKVHVHDLQATILHTLGFDHEKLTYRFMGRDFRLTDIHGHVVKKMLA